MRHGAKSERHHVPRAIWMREVNNEYEFMVKVKQGFNEREENNMGDTVSERYYKRRRY
jgi:hypothetical protein